MRVLRHDSTAMLPFFGQFTPARALPLPLQIGPAVQYVASPSTLMLKQVILAGAVFTACLAVVIACLEVIGAGVLAVFGVEGAGVAASLPVLGAGVTAVLLMVDAGVAGSLAVVGDGGTVTLAAVGAGVVLIVDCCEVEASSFWSPPAIAPRASAAKQTKLVRAEIFMARRWRLGYFQGKWRMTRETDRP